AAGSSGRGAARGSKSSPAAAPPRPAPAGAGRRHSSALSPASRRPPPGGATASGPPPAGSVPLPGHAISSLPARDRERIRRDEIGLIFQVDNLLPFLTAVENVALQLSVRGSRHGYERCAELLARLGLADHAGKLPDQLSGGQRQRVAV